MLIYISSLVARQAYRVAVHEESVIIGNDVLVKCSIQSFVADFVRVIGWIDSEGLSFSVDQQNIGKRLKSGNICLVNSVPEIFPTELFKLSDMWLTFLSFH